MYVSHIFPLATVALAQPTQGMAICVPLEKASNGGQTRLVDVVKLEGNEF